MLGISKHFLTSFYICSNGSFICELCWIYLQVIDTFFWLMVNNIAFLYFQCFTVNLLLYSNTLILCFITQPVVTAHCKLNTFCRLCSPHPIQDTANRVNHPTNVFPCQPWDWKRQLSGYWLVSLTSRLTVSLTSRLLWSEETWTS